MREPISEGVKNFIGNVLCTILLVLVFLMFFLQAWVDAEEFVKLNVSAVKCQAPCKVTAKVVVTPHKDNYRLVIMWANILENDHKAGTKAVVLDQDKSGFGFDFELELEDGCYYVMALLYRRPKGTPWADSSTYINVGGDNERNCTAGAPP